MTPRRPARPLLLLWRIATSFASARRIVASRDGLAKDMRPHRPGSVLTEHLRDFFRAKWLRYRG